MSLGGTSLTDCVVVGAGPAGLAASAALTDRGVQHRVLERGRVGQSWRVQRWDSFRLNTPGWMSRMLDPPDDQAYLDRAQVWSAFDALGAVAPVQEDTDVVGLEPRGDGFVLRTTQGPVRAQCVVVATGDQNVPRTPAMSAALPAGLRQLHAADYRSSSVLPDGAVLVVGSGQSGCQIAADLLASGRQVYVSTSAVGRVPTPYRGRESLHWLVTCGFYDQASADVTDPAVRRAPNPLLAPRGLPLGLPTLVRTGATLLGRPTGVVGDQLQLDDTAAANVASGEVFAARVRAMCDEHIERVGASAPAPDPDPDDEPVPVHPFPELDLRGLGAVVWCTGFGGEFGWLSDSLVRDGGPVLDGVRGGIPGIYFVGLRWLTHRASSILYGFPRDAAVVADRVRGHLQAP